MGGERVFSDNEGRDAEKRERGKTQGYEMFRLRLQFFGERTSVCGVLRNVMY